MELGKVFNLRYMYLNLEEAVYKCSSPDCMFPYRNFKFKNYADKTVYRYKIVSSEDVEAQSGSLQCSWIDSLPISPVKVAQPVPVTETNPTQAFSNAMDQLQTELNDILSSHCNDFETLESDSSPSRSIKIEKGSVHVPKSPIKSEKPRKLSKCYDFIRQKSGGLDPPTDTQGQSNSFKIPIQPGTDAFNAYKVNLQSPKKHRSGRSSKRHFKYLPVSHKSLKLKEPKMEKINEEDRSQALSFLNHVESFNKSLVNSEVVESDSPVPILINVLPQEAPENLVIKVEGGSFNYYGDS